MNLQLSELFKTTVILNLLSLVGARNSLHPKQKQILPHLHSLYPTSIDTQNSNFSIVLWY